MSISLNRTLAEASFFKTVLWYHLDVESKIYSKLANITKKKQAYRCKEHAVCVCHSVVSNSLRLHGL